MNTTGHEITRNEDRGEKTGPTPSRLAFVRKLYARFSHRGIEYDLLEQFVGQLKSELALAKGGAFGAEGTCEETFERAEQKLSEIERDDSLEQNWRRANHAQKLIVSMYSDRKVLLEIELWLRKSKNAKNSLSKFFLKQHERGFGNDAGGHSVMEKKDLLMSIVDSMQRRRSTQHIKMRYARLAIYRVGFVFVISLLTFLAILSFVHWINLEIEQGAVDAPTMDRFSP